jgi:hypothetical protein
VIDIVDLLDAPNGVQLMPSTQTVARFYGPPTHMDDEVRPASQSPKCVRLLKTRCWLGFFIRALLSPEHSPSERIGVPRAEPDRTFPSGGALPASIGSGADLRLTLTERLLVSSERTN